MDCKTCTFCYLGKKIGCLKSEENMLYTEMIGFQLMWIYTKADLTVLIFNY